MLAKSCWQQAKKTQDTDEVETGTGTGSCSFELEMEFGVKCGNENGVGPECGDRLNSPAYKHKHVGYCLHVKAATAAASATGSASASAACATSVAFSLHFILSICQLFNQQRRHGKGRRRKGVAHSQTGKQSVIPKSLIDFQQVTSSAGQRLV